MITNVPSAEGLNRIALRLYFSAWVSLAKIYDDFETAHEPSAEWSSSWPGSNLKEEWSEYVVSCQPDLQSICTIIQQSQELALKARISIVSPYLLLIRNEARFSQSAKNVDFSTLRTLDAVELPGAVNTFCKDTLSHQFMQTYERVRTLRNQIAHLGAPSIALQPLELFRLLVEQFAELWPNRLWLQERLGFASTSRLGFFHDGSNTSAAMEVMHELPFTFGMLQPAEFKRLFGRLKKARRYLCPACLYDANTDYADLNLTQCITSFLSKDKATIECIMCGNNFVFKNETCGSGDCRGSLICKSVGDYEGFCHKCGEYQQDDAGSPG